MTQQPPKQTKPQCRFRIVLISIIVPYCFAALLLLPTLTLGIISFENVGWIAYPAQLLGVILVAGWYKWNCKDLGLVIGSRSSIIRATIYCCLFGLEGFFFWNILIPIVGWNTLGIEMFIGGIYYMLVAITEELWARGVVYKSIACWRNEITAVLISSVLFGLSHFQMTPIGWLRTGIWGLGMAAIRWRTSTTIPQIALHFWVNFNGLLIITAQTALPFDLLVIHMVVSLILVISIVAVDRIVTESQSQPPAIHAEALA